MSYLANLLCTILAIVLLSVGSANAQSKDNIAQLVDVMEKVHVAPIGINDTLSSRIFDQFLYSLDGAKLVFLQEDFEEFLPYKDSLDDEILEEDYQFLDLVEKVFYSRVNQVDSITTSILEKPIVWDEKDTIMEEFSDDLLYAKNIDELSDRWIRWVKYEILSMLYSNNPQLNISDEDSLEVALNGVVQLEKEETHCWIEQQKKKNEFLYFKGLLNKYLNAITLSYDPHSSYYTEEVKKDFDSELSLENEGFGIKVEKEDGVFIIQSISPGSPAWKSNLINNEDVIIGIKYNDSVEINFSCLDEWDLRDILKSSDVRSIALSIRKQNQQMETVVLYKEELKNEDNLMTGMVLEGDRKVGYIAIPSFYLNWEEERGKGCANDVAKEILKLKKDSIEGLILDLRFNGGGSLREAIELAGIFIDVGPVGMFKAKEGKPILMKDMNRGKAYRGPLIILINGASASASEVLAGAMKSYNRGLIVGSSSYGKSTGQIILPIDTTYWSYGYTDEPEHFVKVTVDKLYGIEKGSHQIVGITPDVSIPDIWESYITSEKDEFYPIINDSIDKKVYFTPAADLPIDELKRISAQRVAEDSSFQMVIQYTDSVARTKERLDQVPLHIEAFWKYVEEDNNRYNRIKNNISNYQSSYKVRNLAYNEEIQQMDSYFEERTNRIFNRINHDMMLDEAYRIMVDLIQIQNQ